MMVDGESQPLWNTVPEWSGDVSRYARRPLLIEAAIEEGYPVRLERRLATGRTSTRIVQPVRLETGGDDGTVRATLITRTRDEREAATVLEEGDDVSIVTTRLRAEDERRGPWRVGDAVFDSEFGLGVVQAFRDAANEASVVVRFDDGGAKRVPLERAELRPLR